MCRSVYLPRSAVMPTMSGRVSASSTSAWPKGAGLVAGPRPAIEAIIAEVVRRGFGSSPCSVSRVGRDTSSAHWPSRHRVPASASCHSCGSTRMKWFFSRSSRNGTPLPIMVSQMIIAGLAAR